MSFIEKRRIYLSFIIVQVPYVCNTRAINLQAIRGSREDSRASRRTFSQLIQRSIRKGCANVLVINFNDYRMNALIVGFINRRDGSHKGVFAR